MLPIEPVIPALKAALREARAAVLQAPPGAGKTTYVPLALLNAPWLEGRRIIMLEPRRLAARAAAARMARTLGERVGETVGYRIRLDTRVGPATRIEVVTEGILTRFLQEDPALESVGLVIFDEFHERSLQADLGLALCLETRAVLREDLRLLVMSATLEGGPVGTLLGGAPVITSEGQSYPVKTSYLDRPVSGRIEPRVAAAVRRVLAAEEGDVLVFLPGAGEIRRVAQALAAPTLGKDVRVAPLYGSMPKQAQDLALEPSPPGLRKVVLATSIAETSLTIEGVRVVVDSGLMRGPRFSPRSGMTRLETRRVTRASADQRRGRAGRLGPGTCYRLWTRQEQQHLIPYNRPEILEQTLSSLALELAAWGASTPATLAWLDPPPEAAYSQARDLLARLGALGREGRITAHGRRMTSLALHPRLAHMVLAAQPLGHGAIACDLAALLTERDVFKTEGEVLDVDLRLRLEALQRVREGGRAGGGRYQLDQGALRRVDRIAALWKRRLKLPHGTGDSEACGLLLAFAYPDRVAQKREGQPGRFRLQNGRGAALPEHQLLAEAPYLVVADLDGRPQESRIFLAAPLSSDDLVRHNKDQIQEEVEVVWDREARAVRARRLRRLGTLLLHEAPVRNPDPDLVVAALLDGVAREGLGLLTWTRDARRLQQRIVFMHHHDSSWPEVSDEALLTDPAGWLTPHLYGLRRAEELQRLDLKQILLGLLSWEQRRRLDAFAPSHLEVPSGSRVPVDYSTPEAPVLAVRLQELFGLAETPALGDGTVPLTLHLLSPAHRPVQVTRDLAGFWKNTYFDVKKDLKGRYPKHYWPENPLTAPPTNRAKPRK